MIWRITKRCEIEPALDKRLRNLELSLVIGRTRRQMDGERTEAIKWRICEIAFEEKCAWE